MSQNRSGMHPKKRGHNSGLLLAACALGLLAALSVSLTLGTYELDEAVLKDLTVQGGVVTHVLSKTAAFAWRFGEALGHMGFQQPLLILVAIYGFWRLLPLAKADDIRWMTIFSLLGGIAVVLAESFYRVNSWDLVFGGTSSLFISLVKAAGSAALFFAALVLANRFWLEGQREIDSHANLGVKSFAITFAIILLCWVPYIVSLYPASIVVDVSDQIAQVVGASEYCRTALRVTSNASGVLLNNHHPVMHTLLIGAFVKVGNLLHSYNAGLFLYSILQCAVLASTLAYQTCLIRQMCMHKAFPICVLAFSALNPLFPMWGMTIDKDVYFAILTWWVVIGFYQIARSESVRTRRIVGWGLVVLLWFLARNGGLYVLVACLPFLLWALWSSKKVLVRVCATLACVVLVYSVGIQGLLFGSLGIASGGIQETLSVPFMQTARLLRDHPESFAEEDKSVLVGMFGGKDDVLDEIVQKYEKRPTRSDGVKFLYDNNKGGTHLGDYVKIWMQGLLAHPDTYVQALMDLDYGWVYPENHESILAYTGMKKPKALQDMLPGIHEPKSLAPARRLASSVINVCAKLPLVGLLFEYSNYTWTYLIALILMIRRRKTLEISSLSFIYFNYCICFLGPVACLRYAFPAILALPTLLAFMALKELDGASVKAGASKRPRHLES